MRLPFACLAALLLNLQVAEAQIVLHGFVHDAATGEALIGAHVIDRTTGRGSATNTHGFFSLTIRAATAEVVVSHIGYAAQTFGISASPDSLLRIDLHPHVDDLDGVTVVADQAEALEQRVHPSAHTISLADVETLPALGSEPDILKVAQLLPGVQSGTEGTVGLHVRGGSPDQNLILLDGVPLYNVQHLFGFFSTFNTDALKHVELMKGAMPARYGDRLSSVLDVQMREGNMKEFEGNGSVGLIASRITVEGPLVKDRSSFIIAGRRTYLDLFTMAHQRLTGSDFGFGYYFYDINAKVNFVPSPRDRAFVSFYGGSDRLYTTTFYDDEEKRALGWRNASGTLRWNRVLGPRTFAHAMLLVSWFDYYISDESIHAELDEYSESRFSSRIFDWSARVELNHQPHPFHFIHAGAVVTRHAFRPGVQLRVVERGSEEEAFRNVNANENWEFATFIEDEITLDALKLNVGLRASALRAETRTYAYLQPRAAARLLLSDRWAVKASYARMAQYLHLLTSNSLGLPSDLWVPSTDRTRPQSGSQIAVGIAHTFGGGAYEFSTEGYRKPMRGLIEFVEGASALSMGTNWEDQVAVGRGLSYGTELMLRKKQGRTTGWIAYTLSRTMRTFPAINDGRPFPYRHDRRHDLSVTFTHRFEARTVSAAWVYGTGAAVSLPESYYQENGRIVYVYGDRNSFRLPAYHRLDLSVHTPRNEGKGTFTFSIYNLYNRKNPLMLLLDEESDFDIERGIHNVRPIVKQFSLLPVIPSISYAFTF